jgi:methyl-accepting chemotaxis protein
MMSVLANWSVKKKLMVMLAVFALGLLVAGGIGIQGTRSVNSSFIEANRSMEEVAALMQMQSTFLHMRLDVVYTLFLTDKEQLAAKLRDFNDREEALRSSLDKYLAADLPVEERQEILAFKQGFEAYPVEAEKLMAMARRGLETRSDADKEATVRFASTRVAPLYDRPAQAIDTLIKGKIAHGREMHEINDHRYSLILVLIGASVIGILLLTIAMSAAITSSITRPLATVVEVLKRVAGGDLTARSPVSGTSEVGILSVEVNQMAERMNSVISELARSAEHVASASTQLSAAAEQTATGSEEVAAQAGTVATATEEMAATSSDIARNCGMAADGGRKASDAAVAGTEIVRETIDGMNRIATMVKSTATTVEKLGSQSDLIGEIVATIEDIADQTNLLALNAAIEAARAGDQGRGFAVVADEVRALAERTTKATREIGAMIKAIQGETKSVVTLMEHGVKEVEVGSQGAARSAEAIERILNEVAAVTEQVSQIATAAEEQTATTNNISSNVLQITTVVQDSARGAHESATSANQLARLAEELERIVSQFKLAA